MQKRKNRNSQDKQTSFFYIYLPIVYSRAAKLMVEQRSLFLYRYSILYTFLGALFFKHHEKTIDVTFFCSLLFSRNFYNVVPCILILVPRIADIFIEVGYN